MPMKMEFISDYEENKDDIGYWFSVKCEQKYRQFAMLLEEKGEETNWRNIADLYRYDKRLIVNCFKYISFLEEYLRAAIVKNSDDKEQSYNEWQEKYISDLSGPIIRLNEKGYFYYSGDNLKGDLELMRKMRNCISHNKIVLETDYNAEINALRRLLPSNYVKGFEKDIRESTDNLNVSERWAVIFE